jgi:hypothetical protein
MGATGPWFPGGEPWISRAAWVPPLSWPVLFLVYGLACLAIPTLMFLLMRNDGAVQPQGMPPRTERHALA